MESTVPGRAASWHGGLVWASPLVFGVEAAQTVRTRRRRRKRRKRRVTAGLPEEGLDPPPTPAPAPGLLAPAGQPPSTQCLQMPQPLPESPGRRSCALGPQPRRGPVTSPMASPHRAWPPLLPAMPCSSGLRPPDPPQHLRKPQMATKLWIPRPPARPWSVLGSSRPPSMRCAPLPALWTVQPEIPLPLSQPPGPTSPPRPQRGKRAQSPRGFPKARVPRPRSLLRCPAARPQEGPWPWAPSSCLVLMVAKPSVLPSVDPWAGAHQVHRSASCLHPPPHASSLVSQEAGARELGPSLPIPFALRREITELASWNKDIERGERRLLYIIYMYRGRRAERKQDARAPGGRPWVPRLPPPRPSLLWCRHPHPHPAFELRSTLGAAGEGGALGPEEGAVPSPRPCTSTQGPGLGEQGPPRQHPQRP